MSYPEPEFDGKIHDMQKPHSDNPSLLRMLLVVVLVVIVTVYIVISATAQDPLWFSTSFDARPNYIVIYDAGQKTEYWPGQPGFDELANAITSSLASGVKGWSGIGLSTASLDDAYNKYISVEAFFDRSVKLHSRFNTGHPTQVLFLMTGRHSDKPLVFLAEQGNYQVNAPTLGTIDALRQVVTELGFDITQD